MTTIGIQFQSARIFSRTVRARQAPGHQAKDPLVSGQLLEVMPKRHRENWSSIENLCFCSDSFHALAHAEESSVRRSVRRTADRNSFGYEVMDKVEQKVIRYRRRRPFVM